MLCIWEILGETSMKKEKRRARKNEKQNEGRK
jgi:hypothetical protein